MSGRILDTISSPCDVKSLRPSELKRLSAEIREELVSTVSRTGGHLAPNLGVVELTLGIHRALDCPKDRILFDVGHQSYVHKLLSGRLSEFGTLRQFGGMCGFTKRDESVYDSFDSGHASDSLSLAHGLAMARDARGGDETVLAVIGDGSLTGGMAWEAMNHIGHLGTRLVIVLNDNEMSISRNVGALAGYLARIRLDDRYTRLRDGVESRLASMPLGGAMVEAGEAFKESFKQLVVPGMLFEQMGLKYAGPIDGHDIRAVEEAVSKAKRYPGPVIIHAVTHKGAGYSPAEKRPDAFHGVGRFDPATGTAIKPATPAPISYTKAFSEALIAEANEDERIVAITAAMPAGTGLEAFGDRFPDRLIDVGIAEEHAVALAAGLAAGGMRPVVAIYSTFLQRAYDQVLVDVALQRLPVVFCLDRAGLVGEDGATHHGVFDLTYLRSVPGMTVLAPSDEAELSDALHTALATDGPVAIRYPRGSAEGVEIPEKREVWDSAKARVLRTGDDVALMAVGRMVGVALRAAESLAAEGVSASVIDARWVKPMDQDTIAAVGRSHRLLVTIEENTVVGGFGSGVLEVMAEFDIQTAVMRLGVPDCFVTHGDMQILLQSIGLDSESIKDTVITRLKAMVGSPDGQTDAAHESVTEREANDAKASRRVAGR